VETLKKKYLVIEGEALKKVLTQINRGGTTYCPLSNKDYGGTRNIAVAPFPERSQTLSGKATGKMVRDYCNKNSDLFRGGFALGAWLNKSNSKTYLDVVAPIPLEKQSAGITLGKNANQIAGFNLSDFSEIPMGGTGKFDSSVIPFRERLKEALTLMLIAKSNVLKIRSR